MTNPPFAAFANAAFCHSMDYEAMWFPPTHLTSPVLPALLALSEHEGFSEKNIIEALAAGFEVQGRLRATAGVLLSLAPSRPALKAYRAGRGSVEGSANVNASST